MPKSVRQSVTIQTSPKTIYDALMDSRKHSLFTGSKASISRRVGGKFTAYDGYAEGTNLELVPGKRIVQSWRANDWPKGHYSKTTFTMRTVKDGTKLTFTQTGIPDRQVASIKQGWIDFYWKPLKELLERHRR
ncbi:MAG: SRPBCC domain-containing protein [Armatimonadetes bacterium]|nr:SRPBCC domain-containing protein [Armatimonadota bacterium]